MDCLPKYEKHLDFARGFVKEVPHFETFWHAFESEWDEFNPNMFMYELARELVNFARENQENPSPEKERILRSAFLNLETGLRLDRDGPIAALIRGTFGDWLGRQAEDPPLFQHLCTHLGPLMRDALVVLTPEPAPSPNDSQPPPINVPVAQPADENWVLDTLHRGTWDHALLRSPDGERYFLNVVCGSVGLYTVTIELNPDEITTYRTRGKAAIDELVKVIQNNSTVFRDRKIELSKNWKWSAKEPGLLDRIDSSEEALHDWFDKNGVELESGVFPEELNVLFWGFRPFGKKYQLWLVIRSDPFNIGALEKRINKICDSVWSAHKKQHRWLAHLIQPPKICVFVLTTRTNDADRKWIGGLGYFQRLRGIVRYLFVLDHAFGTVSHQQNSTTMAATTFRMARMDETVAALKKYMKRHVTGTTEN